MNQVLPPSSSSDYIRDPWKDKEPSQVDVDQLSASLLSKLLASRDQAALQEISPSIGAIKRSEDREPSQVDVDQLSASLISKLIASRDQTPAPQGISSSISSIEASTATKPPQFRPELPSPEINLSIYRPMSLPNNKNTKKTPNSDSLSKQSGTISLTMKPALFLKNKSISLWQS